MSRSPTQRSRHSFFAAIFSNSLSEVSFAVILICPSFVGRLQEGIISAGDLLEIEGKIERPRGRNVAIPHVTFAHAPEMTGLVRFGRSILGRPERCPTFNCSQRRSQVSVQVF